MCEERDEELYTSVIECSRETIRRFARAEITWEDLLASGTETERILRETEVIDDEFEDGFQYVIEEVDWGEVLIRCSEGEDLPITWEDLRAAIDNMAAHGTDAWRVFLDWYPRIYWDLGMLLRLPALAGHPECGDMDEFTSLNEKRIYFPKNRAQAVYLVLEYMDIDMGEIQADLISDESFTKVLREYGEMMDNTDRNANRHIRDWCFVRRQKRNFLYDHKEERDLEKLGYEKQQLWREFLEELCAEGDLRAIQIKGYACYGGDHPIYDCDWVTSRDCMLTLVEKGDDEMQALSANTLGYIYYYGRCNGGVPEYDLAYRYFTLASFFGFYEATYKIGDMLASGKGIPKNETAAVRLYTDVYEDCKKRFQDGDMQQNLADAALRMGSAVRKGMGGLWSSPMIAYGLYLEAKTAIEIRMKRENFFGNRKVMDSIERGLSETRAELLDGGIDVMQPSTEVEPRDMLHQMMYGDLKLTVEVRRQKEEIALTFRRDADHYYRGRKILLQVPEVSWCERTDTMTFYVPKETKIQLADNRSELKIDEVSVGDGYIRLRLGDLTIAKIHAAKWTFRR